MGEFVDSLMVGRLLKIGNDAEHVAADLNWLLVTLPVSRQISPLVDPPFNWGH